MAKFTKNNKEMNKRESTYDKEMQMSEGKNNKSIKTNKKPGRRPVRNTRGGKTDVFQPSIGDTRDCIAGKGNDPQWYALNPHLLRDAASFPYAWPLGESIDLGKFQANFKGASLPGIMVMSWAPTLGYSTDATSPINVASINTYTKVRHDNSGKANYDHADLMLYLMAMDSVYAFHSWMRRLYGLALLYSTTNRYFPKAMIEALGVDFDDIQANLANYRAYINVYAVRASALAIPKGMSIMTKHYWMSEAAYFDSTEDKPQTYVFNPVGFYKFALDSAQAGKLDFVPLFGTASDGSALTAPKQLLKVSDIIKFGDALLGPIIADEDFGIMSGDILKSFGAGGVYTLPATTETYTVMPAYNAEVLDQIQNATFIGLPDVASMSVTQDPAIGAGYIKTDPRFRHPWVTKTVGDVEYPGQNAFLVDRIVTFDHGDISPENTMEATRWTNISEEVTSSATEAYRVPTMGTEVMCSGRIGYFLRSNEKGAEFKLSDDIFVSYTNITEYEAAGDTKEAAMATTIQKQHLNVSHETQLYLAQLARLSNFRRHPAVAPTCFASTKISWTQPEAGSEQYSSYGAFNGFIFDVNYYTLLQRQDLEMLSNVALLSEFDVTSR